MAIEDTEDIEDSVVASLHAAGAGSSAGDGPYAGAQVAYGPHPDQVAEKFGDPRDPALVLVHGGFFRPTIDRLHARPAAAALAAAGWQVLLPEYRRVPGDPWASVADLMSFSRGLESPRGPAVWVGHSAGATLALLRALDDRVPRARAVVGLAGVVDLLRADREDLGAGAVALWVGASAPADPAAYAALDPRTRVAAGELTGTPVRLVHGSADATVPVAHSVDFPAPCTVLDGAHHLDVVDPDSPHWPAVVQAIATA